MSIYLYLSIKGEGVKNFQNSVHITIVYLSQKGRGSPNVLMNYGCRICPYAHKVLLDRHNPNSVYVIYV